MKATMAVPAGCDVPPVVYAIPMTSMQSEAIADPKSMDVRRPMTFVVKYNPTSTPAKLPHVEMMEAWNGLSIPAIWKKKVWETSPDQPTSSLSYDAHHVHK